MESMIFYKEILPVAAMVVFEICGVGLNTLFKAASLKGMSYFVFQFYSNIINNLLLIPIPCFLCSRRMVSFFKFPLLSRIFAVGIIGLFAQLIGYQGIKYTSPTMASVMSNLSPAWTFLFALIFRMEKLSLSSSSTQSKIIGTTVSILGALMVVLYKGPNFLSLSPSSATPSNLLHQSSQSNWVIGGLILAVQHIIYSFLSILQTQMVQICPSPLLVSFAGYLYITIISAPVCFIAEPDFNAWRLKPDITLVALVYAGILGGSLGILQLWCLQLKGPVFVAAFKPLSIAIAAAMATVFLGDALHLGSVIGAVMISIGVYGVIWGKAKEENTLFPIGTTPLLQEHQIEDSLNERTDGVNHQFTC